MPTIPFQKPVEDTVQKIDEEVAVGEDLAFQRRWWIFERIVWSIFTVFIVLALFGAFGRGYLARAERRSADGTLDIKYERIERTGTPSRMVVHFGSDAIHNGSIQLYISDTLVEKLGSTRVTPTPASSTVGNNGVTYTFPATGLPATVTLILQPDGPGIFPFQMHTSDSSTVQAKIFVVP